MQINVYEVVSAMLPMVVNLAKPGVKMYFQCPNDLRVSADPSRMQQVRF